MVESLAQRRCLLTTSITELPVCMLLLGLDEDLQ